MTVTLPPPPVAVPALEVDPAAIADYAADLLVASAQVDDLGSFVAGRAKVPAWRGDGGVAYHRAIAPVGVRADALSLALRSVAQRADAHAETMAALVRDRDTLVARRLRLAERVEELEREAAAGLAEGEAEAFQSVCDAVRSRVEAFDGDLTRWLRAVTDEEDAMLAAFRAVGTAERAMKAYAGVADPADAALATMPGSSGSPEAVNAWWRSLTREQRLAVLAAAPGLLGNRDGIPAAARDQANRVTLGKDLSDLRSTPEDVMTDAERRRLAVAEETEAALSNDGRRDPVTNAPVPVQLYLYDPAAFGGDGRVAVAAGDLDTADHVAVTVPGLGTDATSIGGHADRALDLYQAARGDEAGGNGTVAVLAWLGYDAPDFSGPGGVADGLGAAGVDQARAGGERLADTIDGLRASREDRAHVTVIGHSYGSTTAAFGGTAGMDVDSLVLAGSPGAGDAASARDLGVGEVYVIANSRDPVAELGDEGAVDWTGGAGLGRNPAEDDFGAERLQGESTHRYERPGGLEGLDPTAPYDWTDPDSRWDDHVHYYDVDSESLYNMAQVVNDDTEDALRADPVHDPLLGGVQDPEWDREPRAVDTDGDGDPSGETSWVGNGVRS